MKATIIFVLLSVCSILTFAQVASPNPNEYEEHKPLLYRNEVKYGLTIHSAGVGFGFRRGFHITGNSKRIIEGELITMKSEKEIKTVNPYYDNAKAYVYGKLNTLMIFRAGFGTQRILYGKSERGGIEVQFNYSGGFSLGLAKPVYLDVVTDPLNQFNIQTVKYDPTKYFVEDIVGRGPLFKGIDEIKAYPGLYGKLGFAFDWNSKDDRISSLETGVMIDGYFKEVPIMAFRKNNEVFVNFYITFLFGKKWYTN
ncbi:MAG: hypothetical protein ABI723_15120 [Bacteroidia bacterium]